MDNFTRDNIKIAFLIDSLGHRTVWMDAVIGNGHWESTSLLIIQFISLFSLCLEICALLCPPPHVNFSGPSYDFFFPHPPAFLSISFCPVCTTICAKMERTLYTGRKRLLFHVCSSYIRGFRLIT